MLMKQDFFKLLKYSNNLRRNNKYLDKKDPEKFNTLLKFMVIIEGNCHYSEKQEYIELMEDFLENKITADDFSHSFMSIYEGVSKKLSQIRKKESLELLNFLKMPNRYWVDILLSSLYGSCDAFSLDPELNMSSETELKSFARTLLLIFEYEL